MSHEKHVSESSSIWTRQGMTESCHMNQSRHTHTHTCWLQAKPAHTDHHGNSRCLWYDTACQKRPMCLKRALQKDMYTWKERPHRSSRKFKMPAVLHSMSKETNLYEKSPTKDIYLHEKRYHTDHQGNSTCLQYKIHCIQKRKEPHSTQNCWKIKSKPLTVPVKQVTVL